MFMKRKISFPMETFPLFMKKVNLALNIIMSMNIADELNIFPKDACGTGTATHTVTSTRTEVTRAATRTAEV